MSDVGEIAGATKSAIDLVSSLLNRSDRDGPTNELNENINHVQNSFANNDLDAQWVVAYKLFNDVGHPLTPGLVGKDGEREFKHNCLISLAELKYLRTIVSRIIAEKLK